MRIRKPRNFSFIQLAVVSVVGVFGGAYIYKPLLLQFINGEDPRAAKEKVKKGKRKKIAQFVAKTQIWSMTIISR